MRGGIVDARGDPRCSICAELNGPELAKPSAIHADLDFGDILGMDGIKWNSLYFVDQGTTFT